MSIDEFLFFYGHTEDKPYACFSNWYPSIFTEGNLTYANTEQYMMYKKAKLMGDLQMAGKIMEQPDPKLVKQLGRKVSNWDEDLWCANRERIMYEGCLAKFSDPRNVGLKEQLLSSGNKCIVEASPYDKIWGIGMRSTDPNATNREKWKGLNLLGKTLNRVRESLREQ